MNKDMYNFFQRLYVIHLAMGGSMLLFAIVAIVLVNSMHLTKNMDLVYVAVSAVTTVLGIAAPKGFKPVFLGPAKKEKTNEGKKNKYFVASIITWAFMEAMTFVSLVLFFVTANWYLLIFFLLNLAGFYFFRPTPYQFVRELNISKEQAISFGLMDKKGR